MRYALLTLGLLLASPASAETLKFDHRLNPDLGAVLDSGRTEMVHYDDSNPRYVVDRIAIKGSSADNWTEAMEIIVRSRTKGMTSPADWVRELQAQSPASCTSSISPVAADAGAVTFLRDASACPGGTAPSGLFRIVAGKKSLFMLSALFRGGMPDTERQRWLAMFDTARLAS